MLDVVYDATALEFWVAYAKKDIEAYKRPIVHVRLKDSLRGTRHRTQPARLRQSMRAASIEFGQLPRRVCKMQASFTVISGPHHGQTFQVPRGKFIIGRGTDCHLLLTSNLVSRHHCVLLLDEYTLRIRDLASKNGTFVNRDQTRLGERILIHGDTVRVGDMVIRVELESASGSLEAASLETQDIEPETQRLDGRPAQEPQVEQPFHADAPQSPAKNA